MKRNLALQAFAAIAGVAMLAACSSSKTSSGSGATTSAPTTTAASADTTAADTTATTVATTAPSTTVPAPVVLTLRGDGIGPLDFGAAIADVLDVLSTSFGPASSDESTEYPNDDGFGNFQTPDGEFGFSARFGRTVCWAFEFCSQFGGDTGADFFTGWTYGEASGTTLSSTSGVTNGSRWSDFPTMVVDAGGCYTVGSGSIDGIQLTLVSDEIAFGSFDDLGNYIEAVPPAEQVSVSYMQTGSVPSFLFGDC